MYIVLSVCTSMHPYIFMNNGLSEDLIALHKKTFINKNITPGLSGTLISGASFYRKRN